MYGGEKIRSINWPLSFLFLLISLVIGNTRRIFSGPHLSSSKWWMALETRANFEDDGVLVTLVIQDKLDISPSSHWSSPYRRALWQSDTFLKYAKKLILDLHVQVQVTWRVTDWRGHCNYIQKLASLKYWCSPQGGGPTTVRVQIWQWPRHIYSLSHPEVLAPGILRGLLPERENQIFTWFYSRTSSTDLCF